jgi:hypothetical protein
MAALSRTAGFGCWLACVVMLMTVGLGGDEEDGPTKRILVLHQDGPETPYRSTFDPAIQAALRFESRDPVDVYVEQVGVNDGRFLKGVAGRK